VKSRCCGICAATRTFVFFFFCFGGGLQLKRIGQIVFLHEVLRPNVPMYQEVYIVQEYMPSDLNKIIYSKQELTEEHFQYFLYQVLFARLHSFMACIVFTVPTPTDPARA